MRNAFNESMREVGAPLADFWENDLELGLEDILRRLDNNGHLAEWAGGLNGRRATILCRNLGLDTEDSIHARREALCSCNGTLTPYHLVGCFGRNKSHAAIEELARRRLAEDVVEECRINEDKFDATALLFALYREDPMLLRDVFHLSKTHRTGFARMEMSTTARKPADRTVREPRKLTGAGSRELHESMPRMRTGTSIFDIPRFSMSWFTVNPTNRRKR